MPGHSLKNYGKYLKCIELYAKASRIKIIRKPEDSDGSYSMKRRRIIVDPDLTESHEIAVLLHELGHSLDDTLVRKETEAVLDKAYCAMYRDEETKEQSELIRNCEKRAWRYGKALARILKIRLGAWYYKSRRHCLRHYKRCPL